MAHNGVNKLLARVPVSVYERLIHEQWDESDCALPQLERGRAFPRLAGAGVTQLNAVLPALSEFTDSQGRLRGTASIMRRERAVRNTGTCSAPQRRWRRSALSSATSRSWVSSGYRAVPAGQYAWSAVGRGSAHTKGLGCDFTCPGLWTPLAICKALRASHGRARHRSVDPRI